MLPRLCAAELCCTQLRLHCSRAPMRCSISRVLLCSTTASQKFCTSFMKRKFQQQSNATNKIRSITYDNPDLEKNPCTNFQYYEAKQVTVLEGTTDRLYKAFSNKLYSNKFDSESIQHHITYNSIQRRSLFTQMSPKQHLTNQDVSECSPLLKCGTFQRYSTSPDVRLKNYQCENNMITSNNILSSNELPCIISSMSTNGIHSTAVVLSTDQSKIVNLNPDFEARPTLPQRFVEGCPPFIRPYLQLLRIDRPIGTWLLFWPCGWGLALAAGPGSLPDPWLLAVFATGALVMRGAGCTINDLWDKDIDAKVSRTRMRPIASGAVRPLDAWVFLGAQLSLGLLVLLQLNASAVMLGASSLGLVCVYPLVKRVSHWPQFVLGLTFNWGVLLGWCAVHGSIAPLPALPLYAAGVCWTLFYDTIYAHQDKADDLAAGVKSTALRFGEDTAVWLSGFSVAMLAGLVVAGQSAGLAWPYYGAVAATAANLVYQIRSLDIHNRAHCGHQFRHNRHIGLLMFLGIVGGSVLARGEDDVSDAPSCSCSADTQCTKCRSGATSGSEAARDGAPTPLRVGIL